MHWIKQLYKIEFEPIRDLWTIRRSLYCGLLVATGIAVWRGTVAPAFIALGFMAFGFLFPMQMGWLLSGFKGAIVFAIHTINLVLLAVIYLVIVTPLGFALKWFQGKDLEWRREPTEIPTPESFLRPY